MLQHKFIIPHLIIIMFQSPKAEEVLAEAEAKKKDTEGDSDSSRFSIDNTPYYDFSNQPV